MSLKADSDSMQNLRRELADAIRAQDVLDKVAAFIETNMHCDRVAIMLVDGTTIQRAYSGTEVARYKDRASAFKIEQDEVLFFGHRVSLPIYLSDIGRSRINPLLLKEFAIQGTLSAGIVPIVNERGGIQGLIECHFLKTYYRWRKDDTLVLQKLSEWCLTYTKTARPRREIKAPPTPTGLIRNPVSCITAEILPDGTLSHVSSVAGELAFLGFDASKGRHIFEFLNDLLSQGYKHGALQDIRDILNGKAVRREFLAEVQTGKPGVSRYLLFEVKPSADKPGSAILTARDVTADSPFRVELDAARHQYQRLVEYGNLLIVRTDANLAVTDILGNSEKILGVPARSLLNDQDIWNRFVHPDDRRELGRRIRRMKVPGELSAEIRVINQQTSKQHWLMVKGVPLFSESKEFLGWEGFGLEITERRSAQDELLTQSRRIEALYAVSRSLQVDLDPALVTLKGLRSLIKATSSDAGLGCFYSPATGVIELVAAEGVSPEYVEALSNLLKGETLIRYTVEHGEGFVVNNIQRDGRAAVDIAKMEGLKATIVMPLKFEDTVNGAIVLFCRQANRYSGADFDLVAAASSQICLAIRQAESFAAEKRQSDSLAVLYRLSHELSKHRTASEVAEHAFPIIQEELPCKRIWLGVINEQGTHIVGQAGFGPGIRRPVIDVQIELDLRHDFLDEVIQSKKPVVVKQGEPMECSGLNRVMQRLNPGTLVIVPMIALGQLVGILVLEPAVPSTLSSSRKLPLLSSMAAEIATVIMARRFEAKMADADKMRMAGLLASGVAHNFNNMLQAVMGQASLIEMQSPRESPLSASAKMIIDAAAKGAALIKQLLFFSAPGEASRTIISANKLFSDSGELYKSVLGSIVSLELKLDPDAPDIQADYGQMQQVITNLLMNAREAISQKEGGLVRISTRQVRLRSAEVTPELAPGVYLRVDVEDNGAGMDAEKIKRCFEPFFTTKDVDARTGLGFNGSGLGLASAYSMIRQHDGYITVSSKLGEGTVFTIYIPAALTPPVVENLPSIPEATLVSDALLINLEGVVDSPVRSAFSSLGLKPITANGPDAEMLDRIRLVKDSLKLVVIDLDKFAFDFREFVEEARALKPDLKFIIVSQDCKRWARFLGAMSGVALVDKPAGAWAFHAAYRKVAGLEAGNGIHSKVTVERDDSAEKVGKEKPNTSSRPTVPQKH